MPRFMIILFWSHKQYEENFLAQGRMTEMQNKWVIENVYQPNIRIVTFANDIVFILLLIIFLNIKSTNL